ncbi:MAG: hypothetical protein JWM11_5846 [Planctomycetaceae bacterium]|nr:hypothetical protein [Planctomycetaceae bacterium]
MLGKDITLITTFQLADWSKAWSPSMLFRFSPTVDSLSLIQFLVLTSIIIALCLALNSSIEKRRVVIYCLMPAVGCLVAGWIATYLSHRAAVAVVLFSNIPVPLDMLSEVSTYQVVPLILGVLGMIVNLIIGTVTLICRPAPIGEEITSDG